MAALSEWLQIMLGEIARKREELDRAREEETQRAREAAAIQNQISQALRQS